jgi:hypothetical protein
MAQDPEHRPIRFNRYWRGRQPGHVDSALVYGVAEQLVQRRIADWQDKPAAHNESPPEVINESRRRRRA